MGIWQQVGLHCAFALPHLPLAPGRANPIMATFYRSSQWLLLAVLCFWGTAASGQIYFNSLDKKPAGYKGPVFALSRNYPKQLAPVPPSQKPWLQFNPQTQPEQYMRAVLRYFLQGNTEVDWVVQHNRVRKWYHAPSMAWQSAKSPYGREFMHGLTRERNALPRELAATQPDTIQNWAVGFYNPAGGYTFGQVWADSMALVAKNSRFPEGTVSAKLLFTAAPLTQVPYLKGSMAWQANIANGISKRARSPQTVRLLQLDIAVRDARAHETGWVFGTFAYHAGAGGRTVWDNMVPVGLMWGNDPGKFQHQPLAESWINPVYQRLFRFPDGTPMHLGFQGRLDGPVDNPNSSCLSCHSTSQTPQVTTGMVPRVTDTAQVRRYFRNIPAGISFSGRPGDQSLDYSLQMSGGIAAAVAHGNARLAPDAARNALLMSRGQEAALQVFFTSMDYETPATAGRPVGAEAAATEALAPDGATAAAPAASAPGEAKGTSSGV